MLQTYATDETVSDSASTATAMLCGEKTLNGIISCNQDSIEGNCNSTIGNEINSILQYSIDQGTKITQAKSYIYLCQGGYVSTWVFLWICEFVCEQDNSKTYGWILMKFSGYV